MEGLIILVVLALVGGVIILPLVAFIRSGRAIREAEHLRHKIESLEHDLRRLKRQFDSQPATRPTPAAASGSSVPTEPPFSVASNLPESPTPVPQHEVVAASLAAIASQPVAVPDSTNAVPPPLPPAFAA